MTKHNANAAIQPIVDALRGFYVAAITTDGEFSDILFFTNEQARDTWANDPEYSDTRDIIKPDIFKYLFGGMGVSGVKYMLANATTDPDDANVRIYHINAEFHAIAEVLRKYSIATYSCDACNVEIVFFDSEEDRNDWLDGDGLLEGEDLVYWKHCTMPITAEECALFFVGMNCNEVRQEVENAQPHEFRKGARIINRQIDYAEMLRTIAIGHELQKYHFAAFTNENPDIACFTDEQSRNNWVNADPVERAAIQDITDYLWLMRPYELLESITNEKPDASGILWIRFEEV